MAAGIEGTGSGASGSIGWGWAWRRGWLDAGRRQLQQLAAAGEFGLAVAVGQKAVMADVLKPCRGNVQEEAANELVGSEGHGLFRGTVLVVLPEEGDAAVVETEQA